MTNKVQKIREKIEKKLEVMQYQVHRKDAYKELKYILNYIDSLQEEPVSEELEEASKNYALNNTPWDDCKDEIQESFKAGAQWQQEKEYTCYEEAFEDGAKWKKEQMMAKAIMVKFLLMVWVILYYTYGIKVNILLTRKLK